METQLQAQLTKFFSEFAPVLCTVGLVVISWLYLASRSRKNNQGGVRGTYKPSDNGPPNRRSGE